jgi:hypothetical protein
MEVSLKSFQMLFVAATTLSALSSVTLLTARAQSATAPVPAAPDNPGTITGFRPVQGELLDKFDTKAAKAGDVLVLRTTGEAATADGVVIPKGSKLVGHVTDVQPQGQGTDNARVTLQFDQAQLKGGQNLPIRSVIQSVAPRNEPAGKGGVSAQAVAPSLAASPRADSASSGRSGPSSVENSLAGTESQNKKLPEAGTIVAENGSVTIRATAIPGILLASNSSGQPFPGASGALLGARQDVHLGGGTVMVLEVSEAKGSAKR